MTKMKPIVQVALIDLEVTNFEKEMTSVAK